ncbi:tetraacyldisaccharide 4'-kinase [Lentiprolixibacter aurantiacus]|uniref:Tetraacyldisaccharide 4'-kinase n=1 Tax=Lentiprolixibacter aurantiacus TaxID=2993939 RepID=A0AAE3SNA2_9FLAO|nr:tetraacyldisaccharide 4'-kinase [Lentiprolixibacter aurantiacus]MCX2719265.1 tetraacyldisaccharide 4'-kinase [Lentiprolixibacter aurantiacus]
MQLLRKLAYPFSLLYALVVYVRNICYDKGWFRSQSFLTPVVCIGNLSVGGTGKTPMTEWLIRRLSDSYKIAVLSRGYKRQSKGFRLVKPGDSAIDSGDEPLQIAQKFPEITVAVDADRASGIQELEQNYLPELIILDDGFQHRKVVPKYAILLTAYGKLYANDWYLPTGNLRDHRKQATRADVIVVTKCPPDLGEAEQSHIIALLKPRRGQMVLFSCLKYETTLGGQDRVLDLEELTNRPFTLVTGIADPAPMVDFLRGMKLDFDHLSFTDHHNFSKADIAKLKNRDLILTTEKDYMRLKGELEQVYYLEVSHKFLGSDASRLLKSLKKL